MAELKFDAPLAQFDGDEWNEFHDFQTTTAMDNSTIVKDMDNEKNDNADMDNFGETFSGSLEDLVNTFDEKITKCFSICNYETSKVEEIAPVQIRTQEEIINDCEMWWTITGNYGNILPIDWSKSYVHQLQTESLNLNEKRSDSPELDLSDEDELSQAFDMHSLIISSLQQEPLFTADEVISEIEGMMDEDTSASDTCGMSCSESILSSELLNLKEKRAISPTLLENNHPGLKTLSITALNELYEELECTIQALSETLISELALRDELVYEKDSNNQFISLLLSVQKKRRELQSEKRKSTGASGALNSLSGSIAALSSGAITKKIKGALTNTETGTYLTTVIPYHANTGPPPAEHLQIYIKILQAISDDSPTVPSLLTDYILKVLCPTT